LLSYNNIRTNNIDIITTALELFVQRRLDFVDTLLFAYNKIENYEIITFDKKLEKAIGLQE
jgi:predicted nucleic-acid-binding protein